MRSQRFILSLKYTAGDSAASVGKAVGGFLRYVQYRDHHQDQEQVKDVQGLLRYVAWRDVATPQGRLFDQAGIVGDEERKQLGAHIARSMANAKPGRAPVRACYRMVLSPEDAQGLDLRQLARAAMAQLEEDAGGIGPWIAAEHRNTAHPHLHIVLAARREVSPDRFRALLVTKPRLARMKGAIALEISRQRGERELVQERQGRRLAAMVQGRQPPARQPERDAWDGPALSPRARTHARHQKALSAAHRRGQLQLLAARLAWQYRRQAERLAQDPAWEREEAWER